MSYEARLATSGEFNNLGNGIYSHSIKFTNELTGEEIELTGQTRSTAEFQNAISAHVKSMHSCVKAVFTARSAIQTFGKTDDPKPMQIAIEALDQAIMDRTGLTWDQFQKDQVKRLF